MLILYNKCYFYAIVTTLQPQQAQYQKESPHLSMRATVLGQRTSRTQVAVAAGIVTVVSNITSSTPAITSALRQARGLCSASRTSIRHSGIAQTLDVEILIVPVDILRQLLGFLLSVLLTNLGHVLVHDAILRWNIAITRRPEHTVVNSQIIDLPGGMIYRLVDTVHCTSV